MGGLKERIRGIARKEAQSYVRRMAALEKVSVSLVEVRKPRISLGREPWEMSAFLGRSHWANPSLFAGQLIAFLRQRGYRFRVYQEGCCGRDHRPFRGSVKHGYDLVYELDQPPLEFRLCIKSTGLDEPSRTYLVARNISQGLVTDVEEILREVKESLKETGRIRSRKDVRRSPGCLT